MSDSHVGKGATVGSVIATKGAVIPAPVGVDIGCGMIGVKTKFLAKDLPAILRKREPASNAEYPSARGRLTKNSPETLRKE
jgi:tRNA-splicing ligase RtcB (3'-phosphate/5'-hydroxy nucleic acid ligase)